MRLSSRWWVRRRVSHGLRTGAGPPSPGRPCRSEPVGTRRVYRVDPDGLEELRAYLDRFWNRALAAFEDAAERPSEEVP
jgi:hypothetical protein